MKPNWFHKFCLGVYVTLSLLAYIITLTLAIGLVILIFLTLIKALLHVH